MVPVYRPGIFIAKKIDALDRATVFFYRKNRHFGRHQGILCLTYDVTVGFDNEESWVTHTFGAGCYLLPHAKSGGNNGDPPKNYPYLAHALSDFRRSVWLRLKAAAEVVQCCKNCLLVIFTVYSLQTLHGVHLALAYLVNEGGYSQTALERDATQGCQRTWTLVFKTTTYLTKGGMIEP